MLCKDNKRIIYGAVGAAVAFLVVVVSVVFMLRTPEGTLVVTVDQADAEITMDDG